MIKTVIVVYKLNKLRFFRNVAGNIEIVKCLVRGMMVDTNSIECVTSRERM